nr:transposase [Corynebacterium glutamicum]
MATKAELEQQLKDMQQALKEQQQLAFNAREELEQQRNLKPVVVTVRVPQYVRDEMKRLAAIQGWTLQQFAANAFAGMIDELSEQDQEH